MYISVIIPVFNASQWIEQCVASVLEQKEVGEVILIEDGSNDDSYQKCLTLSNSNKRVKLLLHDYHQNLGPATSRNLGISHVSCPYLSFLDSDDYFLTNRFKNPINVLIQNPEFDGVYSKAINFNEDGIGSILELAETNINENKLFETVISEKKPYFSIISLLLKTNKIRQYNIQLDPVFSHGEDLDFIYQLTFHLKLVPDPTQEPKIMRRLHRNNSTINHDVTTVRYTLAKKWFESIGITAYSKGEIWAMTKNYFFRENERRGRNLNSIYPKLFNFSIFLLKHPRLLIRYLISPININRFSD